MSRGAASVLHAAQLINGLPGHASRPQVRPGTFLRGEPDNVSGGKGWGRLDRAGRRSRGATADLERDDHSRTGSGIGSGANWPREVCAKVAELDGLGEAYCPPPVLLSTDFVLAGDTH
jgi:hypothetical protein